MAAMGTDRNGMPSGRKLDFLIACFNRSKHLHHLLETGLAMNIPGAYFVVFDDASNAAEEVPGLGAVTLEEVCRSFGDERVIYIRNPKNLGVVQTLVRYYKDFCDAEYTSLLNPKDEFIDGAPIGEALAKIDADRKINLVVFPLRQIDRVQNDLPLLFDYPRMSGREFVAQHVRDPHLQHAAGYGIMRVSKAREIGIPRDLQLRALGLEDGAGFDHDMVFLMALSGDVEFVDRAPIRRRIVDGYTERFPLTFAYCQYQYARRLMQELEPKGFVSAETRRQYVSLWLLIMARGLVVSYRPVHGTEEERGTKRISPHLPMPILLYLPVECLRFRVWPSAEFWRTYRLAAKIMLIDRVKRLPGRPTRN